MSSRIPQPDTELRFVTKFGENRPLRSCRKVAWFTKQKKPPALQDSSQPPFCQKWANCAQNSLNVVAPWPVQCPCIPILMWIGCVLPDLFWKDWFFGPKSLQYRLSTYNHVHTRTLYTREAVHLCELYLLIYNTCKCIFLLLVDLVDKVVISVSMT